MVQTAGRQTKKLHRARSPPLTPRRSWRIRAVTRQSVSIRASTVVLKSRRRCRPVPRPVSTKPSNCVTAIRGAMAARACSRRLPTSTRRSPRSLIGLDAADQAAIDRLMIELDGTPNKGAARRQCDPGRVHGRRESRRRSVGLAAVSLSGRRRRKAAARADDEHPQRRQARRQQRGLPGVHGDAGRRADLRRGSALRRGDISCSEKDPARRRATSPTVGDEGGFAPNLKSSEKPASYCRGDRGPPASNLARTSPSRSTLPPARSSRTVDYELAKSEQGSKTATR